MTLYLRLIRQMIGASIGAASLRYDRRSGKRTGWRTVLIGLAMLYLGGIFVLMSGAFGYGLFAAGPSISDAALGLALIILVSQLGGIFIELRSASGLMGGSKDAELLFSLPIPKTTLFLARLTMTVGGAFLLQLVLLGPVLFFYLQWTGWSAAGLIKTLLLLLASPLMPTLISAAVALIFMRISALTRRRDLLLTLLSVLAFVVVVPLSQWFSTTMMSTITSGGVLELINQPGGLMTALTSSWPPAKWAAMGLADPGGTGWLQMLLFIGFSLAALAATTALGTWLYQKGATSMNEGSTRRKKGALRVSSASVFAALVAREWKLLLRSPVYVMNGLSGALIGPLMLLMPMLTGGETQAQYASLFAMADGRTLIAILVCVAFFIGSINPAASSSFSREGRMLWILKMLPLDAGKILRAKLVMGWQIGSIGGFVLLIIAAFLFPLDAASLASAAVIILVSNVAFAGASLLIDLLRPRLSWDSETYVMKQNMNVMIAMGACLGLSLLFALPLFLLPGVWGTLVSVVLAAGCGAAAYFALHALGEERIKGMQG